jgi:hypothetical protein
MLGLPGMMVAAITEAERTSENAAAKTLFVVSALKNMGLFLFQSALANHFAGYPTPCRDRASFEK